VLEEGCHFLARGRTAAQLEASFWPWGLSSNACGTLLSDATYAWQCNHGLGHALAIFHGTGDGATKSAAEWEALQRSLTACGFLLDHMEDTGMASLRYLPAEARRRYAAACTTGAWMEYQTEKGNPFPLCIPLGCVEENATRFPLDCWFRHWEGCRREIFKPLWTRAVWQVSDEYIGAVTVAPFWALQPRGCAIGATSPENGQRCMFAFGKWFANAFVDPIQFDPPITAWHLHRTIAMCRAMEGWRQLLRQRALPMAAEPYAAACAGGAYHGWREQNAFREADGLAGTSWCSPYKGSSMQCTFWAPW